MGIVFKGDETTPPSHEQLQSMGTSGTSGASGGSGTIGSNDDLVRILSEELRQVKIDNHMMRLKLLAIESALKHG